MRSIPLRLVIGAALALGATVLHAVPPDVAVGAQYDTTHVYVDPARVDAFVASFLATFGGTTTSQVVATVTPTPSSTSSQLLITPSGSVSVFGFRTPVPYPFGHERTGYLVADLDQAVAAAQRAGAALLVRPFNDPIGRDAVISWPGGVLMQLYWHTHKPSYPALARAPENRVYLPAASADAFIKGFAAFAQARIVPDAAAADGLEVGKPGTHYRRVRLSSGFGRLTVLVTDGQLPWPYGIELSGYPVADLDATLRRAVSSGARIVVPAHEEGDRRAAMIEFPGGYVAQVHSLGR